MDRAGSQAPAGGQKVTQAGELRSARVESLRALAALAVLSGHIYGYSHGFGLETFTERLLLAGGFGVFLFFALSGYLIYWPFARRDFGGKAEIDYRRYGVNRALRILPLYWISVAIVLLWQQHGGSADQWWRFILLSETYFQNTVATVNGPLWSVVVEMTFYVVLPVLALGVGRLSGGSRARGAALIGLCGLASLILWYLQVYRDPGDAIWRYNFPTTFFFFTGGMLVAILRTKWQEDPPRWTASALGHSDLWLLATIPFWLIVIWRYQYTWLLVVPSTMMVAACVLPLRQGLLMRGLEWRPLAALGIASYSLYVWHIPILNEITDWSWVPSGTIGLAAVAIPLSVAVAWVSYRVIEAPFLRLRRRWSTASAENEAAGSRGAEPTPAVSTAS